MTRNRLLRAAVQGGLGICLIVGFIPLIQKKREAMQLSATQQILHESLMAYFEEHESYVRLNDAPASKLIVFFELTEQLPVRPINPATAVSYTLETGEREVLFYQTSEDFKTYRWILRRTAKRPHPRQ